MRVSSFALVAACMLALTSACGPQLRRPSVSEAEVASERDKQQELAVALFIQRYERLYDVGSRVRQSSAELCGDDVAPHFGFLPITPAAFDEEFRSAAHAALGESEEVRVIHVVPGSAADEAGLREGDVILEVEDSAVEELREHGKSPHEQLHDALQRWEKRELPLAVKRGEETLDFKLSAKDACKYPVALVNNDAVNAFADGNGVGITSGMVRFVESDDELALVIGHELAHNTLGHLKRRQANTIAGTILGILVDVGAAAVGVNTGGVGMRMGGTAGSVVYSKEFESESDYLGTYMAARAGYQIEQAPTFWRRMAVEHPAGIGSGGSMLSSHPSTPERATALEQTIAEIDGKRTRSEPLAPERMPGSDG